MTDHGYVTEILDEHGNETLEVRAHRAAFKLVHGNPCTARELTDLHDHILVLLYENEDLRGGVPF